MKPAMRKTLAYSCGCLISIHFITLHALCLKKMVLQLSWSNMFTDWQSELITHYNQVCELDTAVLASCDQNLKFKTIFSARGSASELAMTQDLIKAFTYVT